MHIITSKVICKYNLSRFFAMVRFNTSWQSGSLWWPRCPRIDFSARLRTSSVGAIAQAITPTSGLRSCPRTPLLPLKKSAWKMKRLWGKLDGDSGRPCWPKAAGDTLLMSTEISEEEIPARRHCSDTAGCYDQWIFAGIRNFVLIRKQWNELRY